jgi:RNA-binding protein YlmH
MSKIRATFSGWISSTTSKATSGTITLSRTSLTSPTMKRHQRFKRANISVSISGGTHQREKKLTVCSKRFMDNLNALTALALQSISGNLKIQRPD